MKYEPVMFDIETTGLNPLAQSWSDYHEHDAQVLAIGIGRLKNWRGDIDDAEIDVNVLSGENEYVFLEQLQSEMRGIHTEMHDDGKAMFLVGWNSRQFDHQYLASRFSRKRLDPFPFVHQRKRLDLMRVARRVTGEYWSQDDFYEELGYTSDDPHDGGDIPDYWDEGKMAAIREHAMHDVEELCQIFLEVRSDAMKEFYDHYDIDADPSFSGEVNMLDE